MKTHIETYQLKTIDGKHIRKATLVRFEDGKVIRFMERMPRIEAKKQALQIRKKENV